MSMVRRAGVGDTDAAVIVAGLAMGAVSGQGAVQPA
jgi:hypothetical protein